MALLRIVEPLQRPFHLPVACSSQSHRMKASIESANSVHTLIYILYTTGHLSSGIKPLDILPVGGNDSRLGEGLKTTHAVVDHWSDDGDIERYRLCGEARNNVVETLLSNSVLPVDFMPRPAIRIGIKKGRQ